MGNNDDNSLLSQYEGAAHAHGAYTDQGDYERANAAYDQVIEALRKIDQHASNGRRILRPLLLHEDPHVRVWAAGHLLKVAPGEAEATLHQLAPGRGFAAFNAHVMLEEWQKGTLKMD